MEIVKKTSDTEKQLKSLLYRKHSCEQQMPIWSKGITVYTSYIDMLNVRISEEKISNEDKLKCQVEIYDNELKLKNFITQFNLTKREYKHFLLPKIEELATDEEKKEIDFDGINEIEKKTAKNEIYSSYVPTPANIELCEINELLNTHINILENLSKELKVKLENEKDLFKISKYQKELFDTHLNILNNKKRLQDRIEYYENQFYPQYQKDMEEAAKLLPVYLERAKELEKLNIDRKLTFLLQEYENHKEDKEKLWLFYTALRQRIDSIIQELNVNSLLGKTKDKKIRKLLTPIEK